MNKDLVSLIAEIDQQDQWFADKSQLDALNMPSDIIGREDKIKELLRFLMGYKKGLIVPFISVFGRSGSGKSLVVRFVCKSLADMKEISYSFVDLRKAGTVFGCGNLILAQLGQPGLKSAQGISTVVQNIGKAIESIVQADKSKLFVLVLDEFDVLLSDRRGKSSDFVYKILVMAQELKQKGHSITIVGISNNLIAEDAIDDRVRSRMGESQVLFGSYTEEEVLGILKNRADKAFEPKIDPLVLQYCASISSKEHGDARRALELLRVAGELAGKSGQTISKAHIDKASRELLQGRTGQILNTASEHFKLACGALARLSFLTEQPWHSTSTIYDQYVRLAGGRPVTYRRVSQFLTEMTNLGIALSQTGSKGRYGYGTQYKLNNSPDVVGQICLPRWNEIALKKQVHDNNMAIRMLNHGTTSNRNSELYMKQDNEWKYFVGQG